MDFQLATTVLKNPETGPLKNLIKKTYAEDISGWIGLIFNFNPGFGPGCCSVVWCDDDSLSRSLCLCLCFLLEDDDR